MEFPFVKQYLGGSEGGRSWHVKPERFFAAVAKCENAHKEGAIPNQDFKQAKDTLNRAVADAWNAAIGARYTHSGQWESLPREVYEFNWKIGHPELHTAKSKLKRVTETKLRHPMIDDMRTFLTDIAPLADLIVALKDMVKKREAKPVEEKKEGYQPPPVSTEAQKRVLAVLEAITQATYEDLLNMIFATHKQRLNSFLSLQRLSNSYGYAMQPMEWGMGFAAEVVRDALKESGKTLPSGVFAYSNRSATVWKRRQDWQDRLMAAARRQADEIRTYFVTKNLKKIASIVEAKGNLKDASQISHRVDLQGLTGVLRFTFKDGSRFDVQNQVVWVVNSYGTVFNRFPLTFHNPILADGSKMPRPSQERMNTVFTKAVR